MQIQEVLFQFDEEDSIILNEPQSNQKNDPISSTCSPIRNLVKKKRLTDNQKLANFHNKIDVCGTTFYDVVKRETSDLHSVPVYCDNRACIKIGCQKHRRSQFRKEHNAQQQVVTKSMKKPKAWVFTGWHIDVLDMSPNEFKSFAREKFLHLFRILKEVKFGAASEFSIHMELKFNSDDSVYLHFHVVMGGINCRIKTMRSLWGRVVKYEGAIEPEFVSEYVSKYASKTPDFQNSDFIRDWYFLVTYKIQMHRFSISKNKAIFNPDVIPLSPSKYYNYGALMFKAKCAYRRDSYLIPRFGKHRNEQRVFHPLLEPPPNPLHESQKTLSTFITQDSSDQRQESFLAPADHQLPNTSPDPNYPHQSIEDLKKESLPFKVEVMKIEAD